CAVRSWGPSPLTVSARKSGTSAVLTLPGLVRELCRKVPPLRSTARTAVGLSGTRLAATDSGSSGFVVNRPPHPRRMPTTSCPSSWTRLTTALMQGFSPGTSPPPVSMPMRISVSLLATGAGQLGRGRSEPSQDEHSPGRAALDLLDGAHLHGRVPGPVAQGTITQRLLEGDGAGDPGVTRAGRCCPQSLSGPVDRHALRRLDDNRLAQVGLGVAGAGALHLGHQQVQLRAGGRRLH